MWMRPGEYDELFLEIIEVADSGENHTAKTRGSSKLWLEVYLSIAVYNYIKFKSSYSSNTIGRRCGRREPENIEWRQFSIE